jgi:hypothetical protein
LQLLEKGRTVVAAARDAAKAREVFTELGLGEGQKKGFGQVTAAPLSYIPSLPVDLHHPTQPYLA